MTTKPTTETSTLEEIAKEQSVTLFMALRTYLPADPERGEWIVRAMEKSILSALRSAPPPRENPEADRIANLLHAEGVCENHGRTYRADCSGCVGAAVAGHASPRGTFPGDLDRMPSGHTRHCEARIRHGDGECECGIIEADGHIHECGNGSDDPEECSPFCAAATRTVAEIRGDFALGAASRASPEEGRPDDIRAAGWAVAVHNDYRLGGEAHTFWLFTKDERAVKGEGRTDSEALNQIRAALRSPPEPTTTEDEP